MRLYTKYLILGIITMLTACKSGRQRNSEHKTVQIIFTEMYCGGAAPPDELIAQLSTPRPFANRTVEVFSNNSLNTAPLFIQTDAEGRLKLQGKKSETVWVSLYSSHDLFDPTMAPDREYDSCYRQFLIRSLYKISFRDCQRNDTIRTELVCNPCVPAAP